MLASWDQVRQATTDVIALMVDGRWPMITVSEKEQKQLMRSLELI